MREVATETTYLELLVDTLETINGGIEGSDLTSFDFQLLLELLNLVHVSIPSRNILSLELVLFDGNQDHPRSDIALVIQTLSSAMDSATSTLLTSSSLIVFSVGGIKTPVGI